MELQISHCVCTKVSQESILQTKARGGGENTADAVRMKESGNYRGRGVSGSCAYACGNPAQDKRIKLHGIFEGEEQPDDLRKIPRAEIQIQESGILVPGILRGHGGEECKEDRRVHPAPAGRRQGRGTADDGKYLSPFTGSK